jgi:hypothetical protein
MMNTPWVRCDIELPPKDLVVETKIDGGRYAVRNVQPLKLKDNKWWSEDGTYVYYTPTHWRKVDSP